MSILSFGTRQPDRDRSSPPADATVVHVPEILDATSSPALRWAVEDAAATGTPLVVVDLEGLNFVDLPGLASLTRARRRLSPGQHLMLVHPSPRIQRLLRLSAAVGDPIARNHRVGLIVPSSNTTVEAEIPALLRAQDGPDTFTFHSSRMRTTQLTSADSMAIAAMSERCALELTDAQCDTLVYTCLVAVLGSGGEYLGAQRRMTAAAAARAGLAPVVSTAGALIAALRVLGARRTAVISPYVEPVAQLLERFLLENGIEVADHINLALADSYTVGQVDPHDLAAHACRMDLTGVDAMVLSACVQMPSLAVVQSVEDELRLPVVTATTATARAILLALGLSPRVTGAGQLLRQ